MSHQRQVRIFTDPFVIGRTSYVPLGFDEGHPREDYIFGTGALNPPARKVLVPDPRRAPRTREEKALYEPALAAQFFIGLSVDGIPTWSAKEIRDWFMEFREEQFAKLEAAGREIYGRGLSVVQSLGYWRKSSGHATQPEDSVSVLILNVSGETDDEFLANMTEIGDEAVPAWAQDSVIVQLLKANVVQKTWDFKGKRIG